jgi:HAD superfamily hydrolase (TIGR01459 family)
MRSSRRVPIVAGLSALAPRYDGYILDLWGVLHDGVHAYPGAAACLGELRRHGKGIVILSNAPRRAAEVARRTSELGLGPDLYDWLLSSGEEAWRHLRQRQDTWYAGLGRRVLCFMAGRDLGMLDGLDLEIVDDVAKADFLLALGVESANDRVEDFETALAAAARRRLKMVCANPDLEVVRGGVREICAGALARRYEELGGPVRYHGKPHASVYQACLARLGLAPARVLGVGDSLRTDIAGAIGAGIDSLLVTGGIHAEELGTAAGASPDPVRLAEVCRRAGHPPTAAIGAFVW